MKKCLQCAKGAVLHVTEIRDGEARALHLCETCAQDYLGNSDSIEHSVTADDFSSKLSQMSEEDDLSDLDSLECPNCGITFSEFRAKGRLGCPQDYVVFGGELLSLLENIHGETNHTGKFPKRGPDSSMRHYELIKLRNELRQAIGNEDYEAAAKLRDEIQAFETELAKEAGPAEQTEQSETDE